MVYLIKCEGNQVQLTLFQIQLRDSHAFEIFERSAFKSTVDKEIDSLKQRNKKLKIADKHGSDTVREYTDVNRPLADDSEDAANLRAVISRAM
jgi:hypothetical protein